MPQVARNLDQKIPPRIQEEQKRPNVNHHQQDVPFGEDAELPEDPSDELNRDLDDEIFFDGNRNDLGIRCDLKLS